MYSYNIELYKTNNNLNILYTVVGFYQNLFTKLPVFPYLLYCKKVDVGCVSGECNGKDNQCRRIYSTIYMCIIENVVLHNKNHIHPHPLFVRVH